MLIAAMRFCVPLDALNRAASTEMTSPVVRLPVPAFTTDSIWPTTRSRALAGSAELRFSIVDATWAGSATSP